MGKNTSASSQLFHSKDSSNIKLPSLSLPYFDGGEMEWPSFWERFQSVMATDKNLTDSDKATYLCSALKSKEAIQIITSQHNVDDYDGMVRALKRQYSNPRFLFRKQVQSLVQFESLDVHIGHMLQHKENFLTYFLLRNDKVNSLKNI